ncbi:MAG: hypothetical protein PHT07_17345 [Paludibacter sp.]|nr:hypothetical protein [Paludibacter sp.]
MNRIISVLILMLYFNSCTKDKDYTKTIKINDSYFKGEVTIEKIEKLNKYRISIFNSITGSRDRIYTPYEVFEMETGDVNGDGKTDICIGIIKPTPFDPVIKKRLFIFQIDKDYIRPLWLSSRLVSPLEEFKVCHFKERCPIKAMERQTKNLYCIREYRWESFGMSFVKTLNDSIPYTLAKSLLTKSL